METTIDDYIKLYTDEKGEFKITDEKWIKLIWETQLKISIKEEEYEIASQIKENIKNLTPIRYPYKTLEEKIKLIEILGILSKKVGMKLKIEHINK